jgi:hypothetical protein
MTEIIHFLKPGGWKITRTKGVCETMLPREGMILIGRAEGKDECSVAWVNGSQYLQIVEKIRPQPKSTVWKGKFSHQGKTYWLTVWADGEDIAGEIVLHGRKAALVPATDYATTGTWGAEAGGGGGGGNIVAPPTKRKANGSDVRAH